MERDSLAELSKRLGEQLKALRLRKNWTQDALAERANVALNVVRHLESGDGATVGGLLRVVRALGRTDWLDSIGPEIGISPMLALKQSQRTPRQRAYVKRSGRTRGV